LGAIFISYRRSDSQGEAGRLFDDLVNHFGDTSVFMDVAGIEAGRDFRKVIEESVAKCGVLLVVMGPEWLNSKDEHGVRRLDDPTDFVRIETASALKRDIPVVPVLVRGAEMPRAEQLPVDLKDLAYRNCVELTHARWRSDIKLLVDALRRLVGDADQNAIAISTATPVPATAPQAAATPSKSPHESSTAIDPAVIQRVSRELALHIGPIADTVAKRAASRCTSVEDFYLKVAQEIDSRDARQKFLERARITSPPPSAVPAPATLPSYKPATSASPPPSRADDIQLTPPIPATATKSSSPGKYWLLISAGIILVILMLVLVKRFAAPSGASSSKAVQSSTQESHTPEPAPAKTNAPAPTPPAETQPAKSPIPTPASETEPKTPQRVRVSQGVSMGLLVSKVVPVYPPVARQARVQGEVVLDANIASNGTVESLKAISGHPLLIPAAIDAVKQWRYKPYMQNGAPVAVNTEIIVNFTLSGG